MKLTENYKAYFSLFWSFYRIIFCLSIFYCSNVFSQTVTDSAYENILEQYKKLVTPLQKEVIKQQQIITKQGEEIEKLKSRLDALTTKTSKPASIAKPSPPLITTKKTEKSVLPTTPVGKAPPKLLKKKDHLKYQE